MSTPDPRGATAAPERDESTATAPPPAEPMAIEPDSGDWTYVITDGCGECGFDPTYEVTTTGARLRASIPLFAAALARPDATTRPAPQVWSPLEYGCHVRDTCRIFRERLDLMLTQDDPVFANWDQDVTAVQARYWAQDPAEVARQYAAEATATAARFDDVAAEQWERPGRRSNGSMFSVRTFAIYFLHDIEHHVHDVTAG